MNQFSSSTSMMMNDAAEYLDLSAGFSKSSFSQIERQTTNSNSGINMFESGSDYAGLGKSSRDNSSTPGVLEPIELLDSPV